MHFKCIMFSGENPTSSCSLACKLHLSLVPRLYGLGTRLTLPRNGHACKAKRALAAAVCFIPMRPSLMEIRAVGNHPFFSELTICVYSGE